MPNTKRKLAIWSKRKSAARVAALFLFVGAGHARDLIYMRQKEKIAGMARLCPRVLLLKGSFFQQGCVAISVAEVYVILQQARCRDDLADSHHF